MVNDARLLSVDEAIEQLKAFDDENLMPDISEIYDGRLFYSNAFDLRETIPVYQIYYTNNCLLYTSADNSTGGLINICFADVMSRFSTNTPPNSIISVSYTHLDVYKRQTSS